MKIKHAMFVFSKTTSIRELGLPHKNSMKIIYPPLLSSNGQKQKKKKTILFSIREDTKLTSMVFLDAYTGTNLLFFCICVSIYQGKNRKTSTFFPFRRKQN